MGTITIFNWLPFILANNFNYNIMKKEKVEKDLKSSIYQLGLQVYNNEAIKKVLIDKIRTLNKKFKKFNKK